MTDTFGLSTPPVAFELPSIPLYDSATLRIKVGTGTKQIFSAYQELLLRLGSGNVVTEGADVLQTGQTLSSTSAATSLIVVTDQPVVLTYSQANGHLITVDVAAQFVLTAPIAQWSVQNNGLQTANVSFVSILSNEFQHED